MESLEKNRVFDRATLEEILEVGTMLMRTAIEVTQSLKETLGELETICDSVPAQAKDETLKNEVIAIRKELVTEEFEIFLRELQQSIGKLLDEIPAYDKKVADEVMEITGTLEGVRGIISDLGTFLQEDAINLSFDEFSETLKTYQKKWEEKKLSIDEKLRAASTYLKGIETFASVYSKDPVQLVTGNFIYEKEDITMEGMSRLCFKRFYNAMDKKKSAFGRCWMHSFGSKIEKKEDNSLVLYTEDGKELCFLNVRGNIYQEKRSGISFIEEKEEEYHLNEEGKKTVFYTNGRLKRKEDENNGEIKCFYEEETHLSYVECSNGAKLTFSYDEQGKISKVCDHTERMIQYFYLEGRLRRVVDALGNQTTYEYAPNGRMSSVTDKENQKTVLNTYDSNKRVTKQTFLDGGEMFFDYKETSNTVVLTQQNGSKIQYVHDNRLRHCKTIYEDGSEEIFAYNDQNRKTSYTNRNGNKTLYAYDNAGNMTQLIAPDGKKTNWTYDSKNALLTISINGVLCRKNEYDGKGKMIKTTDAEGSQTNIEYNENGLQSGICLPDGGTFKIRYDKYGNRISVCNPMGNTAYFEYDTRNRMTKKTDEAGNKTTYGYDDGDFIKQITNALGTIKSFAYTKNGKVKEIQDFDGYTTKAVYNTMNYLERVTDKRGSTVEFHYDKMGNILQKKEASGFAMSYEYNADNFMTLAKRNGETVIQFGYDNVGNRTEISNALGDKTYLTYDEANRVTQITNVDGSIISFSYDTFGRMIEKTNEVGNREFYVYDKADRVITETKEDGRKTEYAYMSCGYLKSKKETRKGIVISQIHYEYYPGGKLRKEIQENGSYLEYFYDANQNISKKKDDTGYEICYTYDCLNRLLQKNSNDGARKEYAYDAAGNIIQATDAKGNATKYKYDENGNLVEILDPLNHRTSYCYDSDNCFVCVDRGGKITTYERDHCGRIILIRNPLGLEESYSYDEMDRIVQKIDAENLKTAYTYTLAGELARINYGDGSYTAYRYDEADRPITIENKEDTISFHYTNDGSISHLQNRVGQTLSFAWDNDLKQLKKELPDGTKATYSYNDAGKLATLETKKHTLHYTYDKKGRLIQKNFVGGRMNYEYTKQNRVSKMSIESKEDIIAEMEWQYDLLGNKREAKIFRKNMPKYSGLYTYAYNECNYLTEVLKDGGLEERYQYDSLGNRIFGERIGEKTNYCYDEGNRLVHSTRNEDMPITYHYDNRGNLLEMRKGEENYRTFMYDAKNQLTSLSLANGNNTNYAYDGMGMCIRKEQKIKGQAPKQESFFYESSHKSKRLLQHRTEDTIQNILWDEGAALLLEGEEAFYYGKDDLGTPIALLTEDGMHPKSYAYDSFGNLLKETIGAEQPIAYTGYQRDKENELYYAQARYYDAKQGRFLSEDKKKGYLEDPLSFHPYLYCFQNPLVWLDADGMEPAWYEGIYAHIQLEAIYMEQYGYIPQEGIKGFDSTISRYGNVNVAIPGSGRYGGLGFADMVFYEYGTAQIYEIKPKSHYEDVYRRSAGEEQLYRYVSKYDNIYEKTDYGKRQNIQQFLNTPYSYALDPKYRTITYHMYNDSPGMIYYEITGRRGIKEPVYLPQKEKEATKVKETVELVTMLSILGTPLTKVGEAVLSAANGVLFILFPDYLRELFIVIPHTEGDESCNCPNCKPRMS